jgi:hypothetical protein
MISPDRQARDYFVTEYNILNTMVNNTLAKFENAQIHMDFLEVFQTMLDIRYGGTTHGMVARIHEADEHFFQAKETHYTAQNEETVSPIARWEKEEEHDEHDTPNKNMEETEANSNATDWL